jgi:tRNA dimethylallyltransferase
VKYVENRKSKIKNRLLFIVGPTASGKSSLAMEIARRLDGEIICADSQTVRRATNIGTAKPTSEDQREITHHLLDIVDPYEKFSAADFQQRAEEVIRDIQSRRKLAIVVGGTGLYIDALLFNFTFREGADPLLREKLNAMSVESLQEMIRDRGLMLPNNPKNPRHLIRTIETGGVVVSHKTQRRGATVVGLSPPSDVLSENITTRVFEMLRKGFVDEVESIVKKYGVPPHNWDAIGYNTVYQSLASREPIKESAIVQALVTAHKQYAKKQRSWFRRNRDITWFEHKDDALKFALNKFC